MNKYFEKWVKLNPEHVQAYLLPVQLKLLNQCEAGAQEEEGPIAEILDDIVAFVRAEIMSNPENQIDKTPGTIPQALKMASCHLVIEALHGRFPTLMLSIDQVRNAQNAREALKRVAQGSLYARSKAERENVVALGYGDCQHHSRPTRFASFTTLRGL